MFALPPSEVNSQQQNRPVMARLQATPSPAGIATALVLRADGDGFFILCVATERGSRYSRSPFRNGDCGQPTRCRSTRQVIGCSMIVDLEITMFGNARSQTIVVPSFALAAILALACPRAEAQVKPFKVTGGGPAPQGLPLVPLTPAVQPAVVGEATMLGRYNGAGMFQLLNFTGPLTAQFSSAPDFVFTAANGDQLAVTYGVVANGAQQPGQLTLTPLPDGSFTATFVAEFNPEVGKCTGRFANVTGGSFMMVAKSTPFFLQGATTTPSLTHGRAKASSCSAMHKAEPLADPLAVSRFRPQLKQRSCEHGCRSRRRADKLIHLLGRGESRRSPRQP